LSNDGISEQVKCRRRHSNI